MIYLFPRSCRGKKLGPVSVIHRTDRPFYDRVLTKSYHWYKIVIEKIKNPIMPFLEKKIFEDERMEELSWQRKEEISASNVERKQNIS